ncbi:MAG: hypothetical protein [Wendovervirus sonii]|uniref:RNA ligase n=1 Tax=phage Lak_Megaphage_Sonny TaxID=3109229 RepID=A0ABZ0Z279_9CAUD|nr:MAG: hypothetical protein [phage Lak_Megaphage_Sonny]
MTKNKTLLEFMRMVDLDEKLIWKKSAERQEIFVRDKICLHLLHTSAYVVSTHYSKSCLLPVYGICMDNGMVVRMRENFYGWVVSIDSPFEFSLPENIVYGDHNDDTDEQNIHSCYCEGFKDEWVYPFKTKNTMQSTFRVHSDYDLYVLFYMLRELGTPIVFDTAMTDEEIRKGANDIIEYHKEEDLFSIFYKTFRAIEKELNTGLYICTHNKIDEFIEYIVKYPEVKKVFLQEYSMIRKGENLDNNKTYWIDEYIIKNKNKI